MLKNTYIIAQNNAVCFKISFMKRGSVPVFVPGIGFLGGVFPGNPSMAAC